jgi:diguanylate cyclase (GGDEF)-like protein
MDGSRISILLVEDNPGDVRLLRETLRDVTSVQLAVTVADRLGDALQRAQREAFDLLLLDLSLPDAHGLETVIQAREAAPNLPIIVLTGMNDETLSVRAVQAGAQDYLVKGQFDGSLLARAVRYAIERHRLQETVRGLSLTDELTGLYNRRGFLTFADQHLKLATRTQRGLTLVFADLDGLKEINDTYLHPEGDAALIATAEVLRRTFRESDILARMGGDEFAVIAFETDEESTEESLRARIQGQLDVENAGENRRYMLSFSVGIAHYDPDDPCDIDVLLSRADTLMYQDKRLRKQAAALASPC